MTTVPDILAAADPYLREYGYAAVFVAIFVESFGVPAPGESLLISAAVLAGKGHMDMAAVVPIAWAAAVLGDNVGYAIGRFGGRRLVLRLGSRIGLTLARYERVEAFFARFGVWVVVVARFVVAARQLNGLVAGTASMPWWKFLIANAIGAALWVGVWSFGGHYVGDHATALIDWARRHWPLAAALGVVSLVISLIALKLIARLGKQEPG